MFKPTTIEDARGQRIKFLVESDSPDLKAILRKDDYRSFYLVYADDVLGIDVLDIRKRKSFRNARFYIGILELVMLGILNVVVLISLGSLIGMNSRLSFWGLFLLACTLLVLIRNASWKRWRQRSMNTQRPCVQMLMDFSCCPACMYSLAGQEIEPDGCTVCPECGGAWRLPDESE